MQLKKFLLFGLLVAVVPAVAEEAADRKTATSLKYVTHELDTRQNKFGADTNKAMEYTDSAGTVQKRAVKSDLGSSTSDTSLPMVGGVNTKLNQKQDDIDPFNDHTAVTYTGQPGGIGRKGIYQTTGTYTDQSDNLIDAKTFNAALKNGLDSEFVCREDNRDPVSNLCWLYTIHNTYEESAQPYISATGTATQDGTPTPTNPIYPVFYRQGDMVLRKVGDYADSFDATTHKITRRVGVKVLNGTESWTLQTNPTYVMDGATTFWNVGAIQDNLSVGSEGPAIGISNYLIKAPRSSAIATPKIANSFSIGSTAHTAHTLWMRIEGEKTVAEWKQWLADQYANGTPVTVWYPLATPAEEDWTETTYNENVYIPQNQ